jgi:small subunit ribosomal protein S1
MYNVGDELEGQVTKVVTFGAFVEILDGVEGLVHISELAPYHVENPREIVNPGDEIKVKILEIDSERRRLSLSAKRVEDQILEMKQPPEGGYGDGEGAGDLDDVPELGLSEDVFAGGGDTAVGTADAPEGVDGPVAEGEPPVRAAEEEIAPEATDSGDDAEAESTES